MLSSLSEVILSVCIELLMSTAFNMSITQCNMAWYAVNTVCEPTFITSSRVHGGLWWRQKLAQSQPCAPGLKQVTSDAYSTVGCDLDNVWKGICKQLNVLGRLIADCCCYLLFWCWGSPLTPGKFVPEKLSTTEGPSGGAATGKFQALLAKT